MTDDDPLTSSEEWLVRVRAKGEGPEVAVRVRRWLKAALRAYGLEVVAVQDAPPAPGNVEPGQFDEDYFAADMALMFSARARRMGERRRA